MRRAMEKANTWSAADTAGTHRREPLTANEAFRISAAADIYPEKPAAEAPDGYRPPSRATRWAMEDVAETSALYSPSFVLAAAAMFLVAAVAVIAMLVLTGVLEMHSARDVLVFALASFLLLAVVQLLSACVDSMGRLLPVGPRGPFTYRMWTAVLSGYAVLAVLATANLVRLVMVSHDIGDLGSGALLRESAPLAHMDAFRVLNLYEACLWGCVYMWLVSIVPLTVNLVNRAHPERSATPAQIYAEVDRCARAEFGESATDMLHAARMEGSMHSDRIQAVLKCIREVRPSAVTFWTKSTIFSLPAFMEAVLFAIVGLHWLAALLYSVGALQFNATSDVYRFYFLLTVAILLPVMIVLYTKVSPSVDGVKSKFSREYIVAVLAPVVVAVVCIGALGFIGKGIAEQFVGDDDDDDGSSRYFYGDDDDDDDRLRVEESSFFDGDAVTFANAILYNRLFALVDCYVYAGAIILYYAVIAGAARLRPTVVATWVAWDPMARPGIHEKSAGWMWYNRSPEHLDQAASILDPSSRLVSAASSAGALWDGDLLAPKTRAMNE